MIVTLVLEHHRKVSVEFSETDELIDQLRGVHLLFFAFSVDHSIRNQSTVQGKSPGCLLQEPSFRDRISLGINPTFLIVDYHLEFIVTLSFDESVVTFQEFVQFEQEGFDVVCVGRLCHWLTILP